MSRLIAALLSGLVLGLLVGGLAGWSWRDTEAEAQLARAEKRSAEALAEQHAKARATEAHTQALQTEALDAAFLATRRAVADNDQLRDLLRVARERLRHQPAAACAGAPSASAGAAPGGPAAAPAPDLQADLLGGLAEAAADLARHADAAHIAGTACERAYRALIPNTPINH